MLWTATKVVRKTLTKTVLGTPMQDFRAAPEEEMHTLQVMRNILPVSRREKGIWNDPRIGSSLSRYDPAQIHLPTLLISAQDDLYRTFQSAHYTAKQILHAQFVGFSTGGHLLMGHRKQACDQIAAFLSGQAAKEHSVTQ